MSASEEDVALVCRWFQRLQLCVQAVDFVGARPLFAENMITFGTFTAFVTGREATENEQWRNVWSRIDRFRWRLDDLHTIISGDRLMALGAAVFDSIGYTEDGTPFFQPVPQSDPGPPRLTKEGSSAGSPTVATSPLSAERKYGHAEAYAPGERQPRDTHRP